MKWNRMKWQAIYSVAQVVYPTLFVGMTLFAALGVGIMRWRNRIR